MAQPQQPNMAYQAQQPMSSQPASELHNHSMEKPAGSKFGNKWLFGLFDCFSPLDTCCLGCWCPCVLFGKTYGREHGQGEEGGCSGMCFAHFCSICFGVNSCLQCIMRGQQRERYGIESSGFNDCCLSFWCGCCTLIQEEKESIVRITGMDPKTKVAYQPVNQMTYP